ncbi:hypothetical protein E2320_004443 [Naja naja]|nr:hypothetical protein E2320_004443 [Naja naja]
MATKTEALDLRGRSQQKGPPPQRDGLISWEEYKNATYGYVLAIVSKIDTDKDGFVTEGELKDWIKKAQKKYVSENEASGRSMT